MNQSGNLPPQDANATLQRTYLDYLAAINAKEWQRVATFAAPSVTHNSKTTTGMEYADMIDRTSGVFPGIKFVAERLVCDADKGEIACRIRFDFDNGRDSFYEHVFYKLDNGKIAQVWSMIDAPQDESHSQ